MQENTPQNLGKEFDALLKELLLSPIWSKMWNPKPYMVNPKIYDPGSFTEEDRLLMPSCESEKKVGFILEDKNKNPEWHFKEIHTGYWNVASREILYYCPFGNEPVWAMQLFGKFSDNVIGNEKIAEEFFEFLIYASRPIFELRRQGDRRFYPRGVPLFTKNNWRYTCEWEGGHRFFSGHEKCSQAGEEIWRASFHGGIINSL